MNHSPFFLFVSVSFVEDNNVMAELRLKKYQCWPVLTTEKRTGSTVLELESMHIKFKHIKRSHLAKYEDKFSESVAYEDSLREFAACSQNKYSRNSSISVSLALGIDLCIKALVL